MTEKVKIVLLAVLLAMGLMLASFFAGWKLRGEKMQPPVADTITITKIDSVGIQGTAVRPDADSLIRIDSVPYPVPYPVPQYVDGDTIVVHDTIVVYLAREHRLFSVEDTLDVWYSGIDPTIDSINLYYHHTTEIIKEIHDVYRMPRMTLDVGAGAFYYERQVFPYASAEMRYNAAKTTFSAYGAIDHQARWAAGVGVTYRINLIK